jgi:hypothetical protein
MPYALALWTALLLAAPAGPAAPGASVPPTRIVVDPGHGGAQEGALSPQGLFEKNIAPDVARRLWSATGRRCCSLAIRTCSSRWPTG